MFKIFTEADSIEKIIIIIIAPLLLCLVFIALIGTFLFIDSAFTESTLEKHNAISRSFSPGHYQSQAILTGSTTITSQIWIPDSWIIHIDYHGQILPCDVTKDRYNNFKKNENVSAFISTGRINNATYCKGLN